MSRGSDDYDPVTLRSPCGPRGSPEEIVVMLRPNSRSCRTASIRSGIAGGTTVTFTVNSNANSLAPNTYIAAINCTNSDTGQGTQSRTATLAVNPPAALQV